MKVIAKDNQNRDDVSEWLLAENLTETHAEMIAAAMNTKYCTGDHSAWWYVTKDDDYKLYTWEP